MLRIQPTGYYFTGTGGTKFLSWESFMNKSELQTQAKAETPSDPTP
jgi:hypothetical protein